MSLSRYVLHLYCFSGPLPRGLHSLSTQSKDFRVQSAPCSPVVCVHTFFLLFHMKSEVGILVYPSFLQQSSYFSLVRDNENIKPGFCSASLPPPGHCLGNISQIPMTIQCCKFHLCSRALEAFSVLKDQNTCGYGRPHSLCQTDLTNLTSFS